MIEVARKVPTYLKTATKTIEVLAELSPPRNGSGKIPPPENGITIRAAGRKYDMNHRTIARWVDNGIIPVLLVTRNEKYIDEKILAEVVKRYKEDPGRGKRTIYKK